MFWGGGGGGVDDGLAFWDIHLWRDCLILAPLGSLPIGRSLGRSEIERDLDWEISMETCLVLFYSFSGISTCSGYLELDSSGVIFISLVWDIYWSIVGSIDRSIFSSIVILIGRL